MALKVVEGSGSVCIKVQRVECVFIRGPAAPYVTAAGDWPGWEWGRWRWAAICRGSVVMKRKVGWCLSESQARLSPPHSSSVTSSCLLLFSHFLPSHPSPFLPTVPSLFFLFMWHIWIFSVWRISLRTTWHLVFSHDCRCERQGWGDTPALGLSWSGFLVLW